MPAILRLFAAASRVASQSYCRSLSVASRRAALLNTNCWGIPLSQRARSQPLQYTLHSSRHQFRTTVPAASGSASTVKTKQAYKCSKCGEVSPQWKGRCPNPSCDGWNTLDKFLYAPETASTGAGGGGGARAARTASDTTSGWVRRGGEAGPSGRSGVTPRRTGAWISGSNKPQRLDDICNGGFQDAWRLPLQGASGAELSRVLGGGVVPGSMVLIGGDPGVGKSTLLLQVASMVADFSGSATVVPGADVNGADDMTGDLEVQECGVLYVSGEESAQQIGSRAERMGLAKEGIFIYSQTRLQDVLAEMLHMRPRAVIIDSIQTVYLDDVNGSAGSVSQVRECATALLHIAKQHNIPIFLVGHVTKSGDIAGPKVLEHIVDVVLYMEGEKHQSFRLIRAHKNRYGALEEVGVFAMGEKGLAAVPNPSALFLSNRDTSAGVSSAVTVQMEGTRPMLMEVQALCSPIQSKEGMPLRFPNGVNRDRFNLITAVLAKHARLKMHAVQIHTNVIGGMTMMEPASDLAVAVAIASSFYEQPIARDIACIGEIGLGGEIREVGRIEQRLLEAAKLGFNTFVIAAAHAVPTTTRLAGVQIIRCKHIMEALKAVLGSGQSRQSFGTAEQDDIFEYDDRESERLVGHPF